MKGIEKQRNGIYINKVCSEIKRNTYTYIKVLNLYIEILKVP